MPKYHQHYPGHLRFIFEEAIEAYSQWNEGDPQPTVTYEVHYQPEEIPISRACGLVWNCTDILPSSEVSALGLCGIEMKTRTYAAAAHSLLEAIKLQLRNASSICKNYLPSI
jgi:hypothetical protein